MLGFTFEERDWLRARRELALAAAVAADNDVLWYNLGLLYRRNGLWDDAIAAFERSHAIDPRPLLGVRRVRAADRLAEVRAEKERIAAIERDAGEPAADDRGSSAYHRRLAQRLEAAGEAAAARGHRLRAMEIESGTSGES
jgi:tetratricopeptide (TPR) repeat protein